MPQQENLPINEPGLQGVAQTVTVGDPTGRIALPFDPPSMQKRLWFLYPLASLSISAISGGVNGPLLGKLIASFTGVSKVDQAAVLGLALSISGLTYLIAAPIGGLLSDKTRTRFLGRRNIWILGGAILQAITLIVLSNSSTVPQLIILAAITTIPTGVILAATSVIVPERVPLRSRGRISSLNGLMALIGSGLGIAVAGLSPSLSLAFIILAIQVVVFCGIFAFFTKDVPAPAKIDKSDVNAERPKFPTPRSHPDYWLTFVARALAFMAFGLATGLEIYALRDYFKVGDGSITAAGVVQAQITIFSTLALALSAIVGGLLVDKFGRLKPFVVASSLLFVPGALVLALVPTVTGAYIGFVIIGLAFGSYISVDGVLMTRVIPSRTNAGRDLGVLNVSGSVGSIVAPVLAGALVASTGYGLVFLLVIVAGILASVAALFIRSVR